MNNALKIFELRIADVQDLVARTNKSSVLVIQQFPVEEDTVTLVPMVRESVSNVIAFVELGDVRVLKEIVEMADGNFDYIVFDADIKCSASNELLDFAKTHILKSRLFFYSDNNTWADAAIELIQQLILGISGKNILLFGEGQLYDLMKQKLQHANARLMNLSEPFETASPCDCIIGASVKRVSVADEYLKHVNSNTLLFDVGIGNFSETFIEKCLLQNSKFYRVDIRAGISSTVLGILETDYLIKNILGRTVLNGVEIVAGGAMGQKGAIIVDDINKPNYIIGVADGKGNVLSPEYGDRESLAFVTRLLGV